MSWSLALILAKVYHRFSMFWRRISQLRDALPPGHQVTPNNSSLSVWHHISDLWETTGLADR